MIPIIFHDSSKELLGAVGVMNIHEGLIFEEDKMIIIESIANHVAPTLYQLDRKAEIEDKYIEDQHKRFTNVLVDEMVFTLDYQNVIIIADGLYNSRLLKKDYEIYNYKILKYGVDFDSLSGLYASL